VSYDPPAADASNNEDIVGSWSGGVVKAVITIPVEAANETPGDDISVDQCRHLIIATGSGYSQGSFARHDNTPVISPQKLCFVPENSSAISVHISASLVTAASLILFFF